MVKKLFEIGVCSNSVSNNIYAKKLIKKKFKTFKLNKYKKLKDEKLVEYLKNCKYAIIGLENLNSEIIDQLPNLEAVAKYGVGLDKIDLKYLKKKKIKFFHFKGFNKRSVSELVIGFIINSLRNLNYLNYNIKIKNNWEGLAGENLSQKTIGIIGCGNIGQDLIKLLTPFNLKILVNDLKYNKKIFNKANIYRCSKKNIFEKSDIISLHLPLDKKVTLDKQNLNIINKNYLKKLKKKSILINTSRGGIVNEDDLYAFLKKNKTSKAYFDVLATEPPKKNNKLLKLDNFFISSHIGGSTRQVISEGARLCVNALVKFREVK